MRACFNLEIHNTIFMFVVEFQIKHVHTDWSSHVTAQSVPLFTFIFITTYEHKEWYIHLLFAAIWLVRNWTTNLKMNAQNPRHICARACVRETWKAHLILKLLFLKVARCDDVYARVSMTRSTPLSTIRTPRSKSSSEPH